MPQTDKITKCRICSSNELTSVLDLGNHALSGRFILEGEADPMTAPLELVLCGECGLLQLLHTVTGTELYTDTYGYRSGINQSMRSHLAALAEDVTKRAGLSDGDLVIDVGCNDGTLLRSYPVQGLTKIGIDPLADHFREYHPQDMTAIADFFGAESCRRAIGDDKAKVLTSISMFYDLPDPGAFTKAVAEALAKDGLWVLEQSYMPTMLERNSFDTVCHEHLEYYALAQIERMASEAGLRIFDVQLNDVNGGSFRLYVCHVNGPYRDNSEALEKFRRREGDLDLGTLGPYQRFTERIEEQRDLLRGFIDKERKAGKTFYIYGASTKGNTLLQYYGLDRESIVAAADRNPAKWGRLTPATRIPIISEKEAREQKPDYFLVLPWHFKDEFLERESEFRKNGGKFIFPLPTMEII